MIVRFLDIGGFYTILVYTLFSLHLGGHLHDKERLTVLHIKEKIKSTNATFRKFLTTFISIT